MVEDLEASTLSQSESYSNKFASLANDSLLTKDGPKIMEFGQGNPNH